jgi:hypothetical protein
MQEMLKFENKKYFQLFDFFLSELSNSFYTTIFLIIKNYSLHMKFIS